MSKSKKPDFRPNEYVVYPAHGVGQIVSIEEQQVAGISLELFVHHCMRVTLCLCCTGSVI